MTTLEETIKQLKIIEEEVTKLFKEKEEIVETLKSIGRKYYPLENATHALLTKISLLYGLEQLVYFEVDEDNKLITAIQALGPLTEEEHKKVRRDAAGKDFMDLVNVYSTTLDEALNEDVFGYKIPLNEDSVMGKIIKYKLSFEGGIIENPTDVDRELFNKFGTDKFVALTIKAGEKNENDLEESVKVIGIVYGNAKFSSYDKILKVDKELSRRDRYMFSVILQLIKNYKEVVDNQAYTEIGKLFSMLMHNLRTPLAIAGGNAILAKKELDKKKPDYNFIKQQIEINIEHISRVERFMLGIGNVSWTEKEVPLNKINLIDIINDSLNGITKKLYKINNNAKNSTVYGNYDLLKVAVDNIFNNCVEAISEDRNPVLEKENKLIIDIYNDPDNVYIKTNNRQSIPYDIKGNLFSFGYTTKVEGNGFGLKITNKIVDKHKGKLTFTSDKKEGTIFTINLPLYKE